MMNPELYPMMITMDRLMDDAYAAIRDLEKVAEDAATFTGKMAANESATRYQKTEREKDD